MTCLTACVASYMLSILRAIHEGHLLSSIESCRSKLYGIVITPDRASYAPLALKLTAVCCGMIIIPYPACNPWCCLASGCLVMTGVLHSKIWSSCDSLWKQPQHSKMALLRTRDCPQARGLAERVSEDPPTIRLLFKHKNDNQVTGTDQFYSERKRNCCVACGEAQHYLRYRVSLRTCAGLFPVQNLCLHVCALFALWIACRLQCNKEGQAL